MSKVLAYGMTDNPGGIETYLINTMKELNKNDVKMDFLCDFPKIAYADEIEGNNSLCYLIPAKGKNLLKHWRAVYSVLKRHPEYKTVYFNILDAGAAFTMVIPWIMGRNIVTHSHNGATDKKQIHRICRPFLNYMTKKYLACSKLAAEFMYGDKIVQSEEVMLVPNAIDVEKFRFNPDIREKKRKELGISKDAMVICHVGRMSNQKNPFGLLDIFKKVVNEKENSVLLYVGTGELEREVLEYANKIQIDSKIIFLGARSDVNELMQASDVFCLPSFYEGLPIVAIEAQASGMFCILSCHITKEVDVTGNVSFLSLSNTNEWSEVIIINGEKQRCEVDDIFEKSEFNIKNYEKIMAKICNALVWEENE